MQLQHIAALLASASAHGAMAAPVGANEALQARAVQGWPFQFFNNPSLLNVDLDLALRLGILKRDEAGGQTDALHARAEQAGWWTGGWGNPPNGKREEQHGDGNHKRAEQAEQAGQAEQAKQGGPYGGGSVQINSGGPPGIQFNSNPGPTDPWAFGQFGGNPPNTQFAAGGPPNTQFNANPPNVQFGAQQQPPNWQFGAGGGPPNIQFGAQPPNFRFSTTPAQPWTVRTWRTNPVVVRLPDPGVSWSATWVSPPMLIPGGGGGAGGPGAGGDIYGGY